MTPDIETVTTEALTKVMDWAEAAEGFAVDQAPLLAQEIIRLGIVECVLGLSIYVTLVITTALFALYSWKRSNGAQTSFKSENWSILMGLSIVASGGFAITAMAYVGWLLKPLLAPRLYLLQELAKLMS